jgi:hypothetical protein
MPDPVAIVKQLRNYQSERHLGISDIVQEESELP